MATVEREVSFRSGADRIHGTFASGKGRGRRPLAILVHGFGSFRDELTGFVELAARLAASGISSLRLDMRGCGMSGTRGLMRPMYDWVEDVRSAVSFAETVPEVAADRIGVVGMSMGGGIATISAALDPRIKVVVALAPVANGEASFEHLWSQSAGPRAWQEFKKSIAEDRRRAALKGVSRMVNVVDAMGQSADGRRAFKALRKTYPEFLPRITLSTVDSALAVRAVPFAPLIAPRPYLIIHSRADESVPYQQAEELAAAAGQPNRLVLLEKSPHCFWVGNNSVAVQEETREWLVKHL